MYGQATLSTSFPFATSTRRPKWCKKSAPRRGLCTSAMINIQRKVLRKPILRVSERVPYVAIDVPLTAESVNPTRFWRRSAVVGGSTLTCAPVSTRKVRLFVRSVMCNRRQVRRPDALVTSNCRPSCLTVERRSREVCTSWLLHHIFDDPSTWRTHEQAVGRGWMFGCGKQSAHGIDEREFGQTVAVASLLFGAVRVR